MEGANTKPNQESIKMSKSREVGYDQTTFDVPEIGKGQPVDSVGAGDKNFEKAIRQEAFMNELITIRMHIDTTQGKNAVVMPQVNGVNQPIPRGVPVRIKRKYLEILARNKKEDFKQIGMDIADIQRLPDNVNTNRMIGTSMLVDGFEIIEDRNPIGRDWLDKILLEKR